MAWYLWALLAACWAAPLAALAFLFLHYFMESDPPPTAVYFHDDHDYGDRGLR
jgi:hypothetical protein